MTRSLALCLALLVALAACQAGPRAVGTAARPSPGPKSSGSSSSTSPAAVRALQKPAGSSRLLEGTVQLDAGYMASVAAGRQLGDGYAVAAAQLLSNNGGNIISDNGGGIVSNNGSGVVSNNGGGLTAKVKWGLLADAAPALGQQLPIAGMAVAVIGLADGQPLSLGVDAGGQPAYAIYTDAHGRFQVYLPDAVAGNVAVVAAVPDTSDPRLSYGLVVDAKAGGEQHLTEESAVASAYVRNVIYRLMADATGADAGLGGLDAAVASLPAAFRDTAKTGLAPYLAYFRGHDRSAITIARQHRALRRFTDALVARLDLASIQTLPFLAQNDLEAQVPTGPAVPALEALLKEVDERAGARLAADPHFFEGKPYVTEANFHRAAVGLPPVDIRRPSDVGRFTSEEYEGATHAGRVHSAWTVLVDLGLPAAKDTILRTIYQSIFLACMQEMYATEAVQAELVALQTRFLDEEAAHTQPEPAEPAAATPPFAIASEPPVTVGTLVGMDAPGATDGPAATATVGAVGALALDAAGHLYFTQLVDARRPMLRMVDLNAPAHPVSTLITDDSLQLSQPSALVFDPGATTPTLYLGDSGLHRVFKVELAAGQPAKLTALAGSGTAGTTDGPGAGAAFDQVDGLALDGRGGLLLTDPGAERVRRIDLQAADHPVTTLVGAARPDGFTPGSNKGGALDMPRGIAVAPTGEIYVSETAAGRLWRLDASGVPRLVAGWSNDFSFGDGFFIGAGLGFPYALAFDLDGSILVADWHSERVRRVRLQAGAGVVTTVAGSGPQGQGAHVDGPGDTARFAQPGSLAIGPDGTIYVADSTSTRIRTIKR